MERDGFETSFTSDGYLAFVHAEALDSNRRELGNTSVLSTLPPDVMLTGDDGSISTKTEEFVGEVSSYGKEFSIGINLTIISWQTLMLGHCVLILVGRVHPNGNVGPVLFSSRKMD